MDILRQLQADSSWPVTNEIQASNNFILFMTQSKTSSTHLKAVVAIVIIAFAGLGAFFFLTTETGCTYQNNPGGNTHNGQQTYWEKLVGGICHPLATAVPPATNNP